MATNGSSTVRTLTALPMIGTHHTYMPPTPVTQTQTRNPHSPAVQTLRLVWPTAPLRRLEAKATPTKPHTLDLSIYRGRS